MDTTTKERLMSKAQSNHTPAAIAADLRRVADMLDTVTTLMPHLYASLTLQPHTTSDDETVRVIDAIGQAVAGRDGASEPMSGGAYHYDVSTRVGVVRVAAFTSIASPAERELLAEVERLRAELAANAKLAEALEPVAP